jgi:microcystin-dependent protein
MPADIAATLASWVSTSGSNQPSGTTSVSSNLDDNIRELQGVVVRGLSHKGADIASATTTDLGAVEGLFHDITGTATITGFGTVRVGIWKVLKFEGALTLTHNATSLILPGAGNILTADGDIAIFTSEGSGNWRCIHYQLATTGYAPVGTVISYAGLTEPPGWIFCFGQAISRTTFARLFAVLSTTYGVGDGVSTFNVPDCRGRVIAGQDDMGGSSANRLTGVTGSVNGDVLGGAGGEETHVNSIAEMPSHNHPGSSTDNFYQTAGTGGAVYGSSATGESSNNTISVQFEGGGGAHNNVQPTIILNYLIKT